MLDPKQILSEPMVAEFKRNEPLPKRPIFEATVRLFDILFALTALTLAGIPLLIIMFLIWMQDKGSPIFKQSRLGKNATTFHVIKLRTMIMNADKVGKRLRVGTDDPRITKLGKFLRKTHLDEVPQFVNVLKGDMAIIGPRPTLPFQFDYYEDWEKARVAVRPGVTGISQAIGGNNYNWDEKIILDVYYVRKRSHLMHLAILAKTVVEVLTGHGTTNEAGAVHTWTRGVPKELQEDPDPAPQTTTDQPAVQATDAEKNP